MKEIPRVVFLVGFALYAGNVPSASAQEVAATDTSSISVPEQHDPYDLSQAAEVDRNDVYASSTNHLLALPRYLWGALVYPVGALGLYAEHVKITSQVLAFFTNEDGTFGVLPQVQLGGETGTGGGARIFHTNIAGKRKIFDGLYIYSGGRGQLGKALYLDPSVLGSRFYWKTGGSYLRTRNSSANINAAVREDLTRRFQIEQTDVETALGWRLRAGKLAPYLRNVSIEGRVGYGRRDFRTWSGGVLPLTDPGSTPEARLLTGLGQKYELYRFGGRIAYDDRDYRHSTREIDHPLNYKLPGRVVTYADGLYYFYRDLGYPERGGLVAFEGEWVTGPDDFRFYRVVAEVHGKKIVAALKIIKFSFSDRGRTDISDPLLLGAARVQNTSDGLYSDKSW